VRGIEDVCAVQRLCKIYRGSRAAANSHINLRVLKG